MKEFNSILPFIKENFWQYFFGILALIAVDMANLLQPQLIKGFTDSIQFGTVTRKIIGETAIKFILLGFIMALGRYLWRTLLFGTSRKLEYFLRDGLFKKFLELDQDFYNEKKTGDLMAHATNDVNTIRMTMGPGIMMVIDAVFMSLLTVFMIFRTVGIKSGLISLLALPFITFVVTRFSGILQIRSREVQDAFSYLTDRVQEDFSGIRVIKGFAIEEDKEEAFSRVNKNNYDKNMDQIKVSGLFDPLINMISGLSFVIFFLYGSKSVMLGNMTIGDFLAIINYLQMIVWPLIALGMVFSSFQRGLASMNRLNEIFKREAKIKDIEGKELPEKSQGLLEFKNVSFKYKEDLPYVLKDINLKLKPGQSLAIVGRTGAGKSSLVNLILRLYDVTEGLITIDGEDIRDLKLKDLREEVAYAPQDNFLFSKTIRENINFSVEEILPLEEIEAAAKFANVHEDIKAFNRGYDTVVGERGVTLSGGQKQRVSLARAKVKEADILILDDSLSAVDTETEEKILENIGENRGQSLILISQRISTVKNADKIIVLDEGRIIQEGDNYSLLEEDGL